ncbi:hypothetical protein PR202_ga12370 [Eleusine coracana subsp. coracana]|uniref:Uncharacterized protein n=1 Tax=Eleusine coracana subsp. coracana TaxID=191504 RepID=A0AAV5CC16_ELECO|nr:hypothetical protein PR202_ga12370 [Eleusine coracana subsp. coracana]
MSFDGEETLDSLHLAPGIKRQKGQGGAAVYCARDRARMGAMRLTKEAEFWTSGGMHAEKSRAGKTSNPVSTRKDSRNHVSDEVEDFLAYVLVAGFAQGSSELDGRQGRTGSSHGWRVFQTKQEKNGEATGVQEREREKWWGGETGGSHLRFWSLAPDQVGE